MQSYMHIDCQFVTVYPWFFLSPSRSTMLHALEAIVSSVKFHALKKESVGYPSGAYFMLVKFSFLLNYDLTGGLL